MNHCAAMSLGKERSEVSLTPPRKHIEIPPEFRRLKPEGSVPQTGRFPAAISKKQAAVLSFEISVQKAFEALTVARFVTCHFVNAVMKGIETHLFALLRESGLAGTCAVLSSYTSLKVILGLSGNDFPEHQLLQKQPGDRNNRLQDSPDG